MPCTGTLRSSSPVDVFPNIGRQTVQGPSSPGAEQESHNSAPRTPSGTPPLWLPLEVGSHEHGLIAPVEVFCLTVPLGLFGLGDNLLDRISRIGEGDADQRSITCSLTCSVVRTDRRPSVVLHNACEGLVHLMNSSLDIASFPISAQSHTAHSQSYTPGSKVGSSECPARAH